MSRSLALMFALVVLFAAAPLRAEERHSGTVKSVDPQHMTLVLEEMGPWTGDHGGFTTHTFKLGPGTDVALVSRTPANPQPATPEDWPGGYRQSQIDLSRIRPGDFVTVVVDREHGQAMARAITLVQPDVASGATGGEPAASPGPARLQSR